MFDARAVKLSFSKAADHYDTHAELQRDVRRQLLALAMQCWPKAAQVLDLGCGTGMFLDDIRSLKLSWRAMGCDLAPGMCNVVAKNHRRVACADAEHLPFADASFDGVFSSLMLQWISDPRAAFDEMARVLKPGCHAVVSTFAEGTLYELAQAFAAIDEAPHVSRFAPPHALMEAAHHAGFSMLLAHQVPIVQRYPDTVALMRALQNIGATNAEADRKRGLMTSRQFARLEQSYAKRFSSPQGLPATWQALYLVLQKT